ncbi:hypothetical protein ANRL3_00669 [Anaerolineae bacterium]|nr:hypothetical protein ANRL3_00669 [Anaerolineae bacterium]
MTTAVLVATLKALVVFSIIILIVGLIKPKWVLFWMKEPSRVLASSIALIILMASFTGYTQLTVKPKPKSERERTQDELNELNLGQTPKR